MLKKYLVAVPLLPLVEEHCQYPTYTTTDGVILGERGEPITVDPSQTLPSTVMPITSTYSQVQEYLAQNHNRSMTDIGLELYPLTNKKVN